MNTYFYISREGPDPRKKTTPGRFAPAPQRHRHPDLKLQASTI